AVTLVQFCAHTTMFLTYVPKHGAEELGVIQAMQSHYFSFSGSLRSYWDFYFGYGLFSAFNCVLEAVLLWILAARAATSPALVRQMAGVFCLANIGYTLLVRIYFFPLPGYFDLTVSVLLGLAVLNSQRGTEASPAPIQPAT
ncbi:MAG TPA: hypothetical protein VGE93_00530, partial [Bryobacteraceae bacterium]